MKFRQVVRGGRATLAAAAGTVMVVGGAGAGTAALALSHSAGALSLQAPAIAVREQNVNSAGRIRVALPSGGVGVNGTVAVSNFPKTVNVGNLPTNAAGRVQTQNGRGASEYASGYTPGLAEGHSVTIANVTGTGVFKGVEMGTDANSPFARVTVIIDGRTVFSHSVGIHYWFPNTANFTSGQGLNANGGWSLSFFPPGGFAFHKSLVVTIANQDFGSQAQTFDTRYDTWYSLR